MNLLIERYNIIIQIGEYKKQNNIPVLDKSREQFIYDKINSCIHLKHIEILKKIYESMMNETKKFRVKGILFSKTVVKSVLVYHLEIP